MMERSTIIQKCKRLRLCLALAVFSCLVGCGGSAVEADLLQPRVLAATFPRQLALARANWAAKGLSSYRFTVQVRCFCLEENTRPVTITVREGATDAPSRLSAFATIEKVFETLEAANTSKANALEVNFTADGWPSTSSVDPRADTSDDEYDLTISEVRPL
ncbi:DUF6174 domain-containing protein [Armatimonas sp.]|uniref:DUF6174 domain-containing protein n=1 Tax=Armatimonas sp. TaxID=1872638 RepID=UPI003752C975